MRKGLTVLFVASTVIIAATGLYLSSNGSFAQLKAEDNSHSYSLTFTKSNITSSSVATGYPQTGTFSFSTNTTSGATFEVTGATAKGDKVLFDKNGSNHMVDSDAFDDGFEEASFNISFHFNGILSATSVTVYGNFEYPEGSWEFDKTEMTFTGSNAVNGEATIVASASELNSFYISSIVVQYTCAY